MILERASREAMKYELQMSRPDEQLARDLMLVTLLTH